MAPKGPPDPAQLVDHRQVTAIVADRAFPLLLETFLYALYTVLTVYFVYRKWFGRKITSLPIFMLVVTLGMYILFSAYWAIDVYLLWVEVYRYLPQQQTQSESIMFLDGLLIPWSVAYYVQTAFQFVMLVLGDTVSLWRAYVIWGRPRWLFLLFLGISIVESGAYILVLVVLYAQGLPVSSHGFGYSFYEDSYNATFLVANVLTACAQLFATVLIVYKAWVYWKDVRQFSHQYQVRQAVALLAVIIESGAVYFGLLLWYGLIDYLGSPDTVVYASVFYYMTPLIAMYPTLVVVLVATRRSVLERSIETVVPATGLHFAANMRGIREDHDRHTSANPGPAHHQIEIELEESSAFDSSAATSKNSGRSADGGALYNQDDSKSLAKPARSSMITVDVP